VSEQLLHLILDKMTSIDGKIDKIELRMGSLETRIDSVESKIDSVEMRLGSLETQMDSMESKLEAVDTTIGDMQSTMGTMQTQIGSMNDRLNRIELEVKMIKADTSDIPLIRRAVLETADLSRNIDRAQKSFERKAIGDLSMHDHSIDILNRRQLRLESELERLKT